MRNSFIIGDGNDFIDKLQIKVARNEARANTLNFMRARFEFFTRQCLGDNRGVSRFYRDGDQVGFAFSAFNVTGHAS